MKTFCIEALLLYSHLKPMDGETEDPIDSTEIIITTKKAIGPNAAKAIMQILYPHCRDMKKYIITCLVHFCYSRIDMVPLMPDADITKGIVCTINIELDGWLDLNKAAEIANAAYMGCNNCSVTSFSEVLS